MSSIVADAPPLSDAERAELAVQENRIEGGFLEIAAALAVIKERQLFREYGSWDDYCRTRWSRSGRYANYLIIAKDAAEVIQQSALPLPSHESQLRPLAGQSDTVIQAAWESATQGYGETPSAKQVQSAVNALVGTNETATRLEDQLQVDPVKRMVYAGNYSLVSQRMDQGVLTPKQALAVVDALNGCAPKVKGALLLHEIFDPTVIREMNRIAAKGSESYQEIIRTGYLQFGDEHEAIPAKSMTAADLRRYLDYRYQEHRQQAIAEREAEQGLQTVMVVLYANSPARTAEVLRQTFSPEMLSEIVSGLMKAG